MFRKQFEIIRKAAKLEHSRDRVVRNIGGLMLAASATMIVQANTDMKAHAQIQRIESKCIVYDNYNQQVIPQACADRVPDGLRNQATRSDWWGVSGIAAFMASAGLGMYAYRRKIFDKQPNENEVAIVEDLPTDTDIVNEVNSLWLTRGGDLYVNGNLLGPSEFTE